MAEETTKYSIMTKTGIKDFIIMNKIGEGSYSSVWKVRRK